MTTITDDFNRAALGANWGAMTAYSTMAISASTVLVPGSTSADCGNKYTATTLSTDNHVVQAEITINTVNSTNSVWLLFRMAGGATVTGYLVAMPRFGGTRQISKAVANVITVLASESDGTPTGMRVLKGQVVGSQLSLYVDNALRLLTVDTSITSGTSVGIVGYYEGVNRWNLDNWSASDYEASAVPGLWNSGIRRG